MYKRIFEYFIFKENKKIDRDLKCIKYKSEKN